MHKIQAWNHDTMKTELLKKRSDSNTPWCREQEVKTSFVKIAKAPPCPPDLAWDAFHDDVPVRITLECILSIEDSWTVAPD